MTQPVPDEDSHSAPDALDRWGRGAAALAGLGGMYVLGRDHLPFGLACPLLATTGVPCPFCGLTRLADALVGGRVGHGIAVDPGGVAFLIAIVVVPVMATVLRGRHRHRRDPARRVLATTLALGLAVHWGTVILHGSDIAA